MSVRGLRPRPGIPGVRWLIFGESLTKPGRGPGFQSSLGRARPMLS